MSKKVRYRIGIDVGLYSVGLAAIEIDDSSENPYDSYPIDFLSIMTVKHDGAIDPSAEKNAESRKSISGVARRTRRLHKRQRKLYQKLDNKLVEYGYPVKEAIELTASTKQSDPYIAWRARIGLVEGYITSKKERKLALAIALRHIIRHRGWRNSYSRYETLSEINDDNLNFYHEFIERANAWRVKNGQPTVPLNNEYSPTVAQIIEPLLAPLPQNRFRKEAREGQVLSRIDKLHQSTYYHELKQIFACQKVPETEQDELLKIVFYVTNPKDIGAASELVGFDDLQPKKKRASKASIAFQQYRILTTIANLRIKEGKEKRALTVEEKRAVYEYLTSEEVNKMAESPSWHDVAEIIGIERNKLSGVGGSTEDGMPISSQQAPTVATEKTINKLPKSLAIIVEWWKAANTTEKELFIEMLGNAGIDRKSLSSKEQQALGSVENLLFRVGELGEDALADFDKIALVSGRAAYSVDTLQRLNTRMLKEGLDLHEARKAEFDVDDNWRPKANLLGTPTGSPAVDRTIKIVSRWVKACERKWGKPETVNIEHVREGFMSEKQNRDYRHDIDRRYKANQKTREELAALGKGVRGDYSPKDIRSFGHNDTRRLQAIQRQNCQCLYCGNKITFSTAQMDHIVPRKGAGSSNVLPNLVAVCANCNESKNKTLFSKWASPEQIEETIKRVNGMLRDSYFSSEKQFRDYKRDVISRLKQTEEDPPIDVRSIESVAWMARELRDQIAGHFEFDIAADPEAKEGNALKQRVCVYKGSVTAEARKASGIENDLPWFGGASGKTRLDRRHHAVDAAVIALLRPSVAKTLIERDSYHREEAVLGAQDSKAKESWGSWKGYEGATRQDQVIYRRWRDKQMDRCRKVLQDAMNKNKIVVMQQKRLRLEVGKAHEDTIKPLVYKKVGDKLSATAIDKAETPALWLALTSHSDYTPEKGLTENRERCIQVHGKVLEPNSQIGFLCEKKGELDKKKDAVYASVRGGMAKIGNAIHHARFYRIPKVNSKGEQTGWKFAMLRVFQADLLKLKDRDLFTVELKPQSISIRASVPELRKALAEGTAEYLGWAVVGQELIIRPESSKTFSKDGKQKINIFLSVFPNCAHYEICGFSTNSKILIKPLLLAQEGGEDIECSNDKVLETTQTVLSKGVPLEVNPVLSSQPLFVHRNTLGMIRWQSNNNMPVSWCVPKE